MAKAPNISRGCKVLLLTDVIDLGKSGDCVTVKPGYFRNYLSPQNQGVIATKASLRMQERLQEERKKQATTNRKESEDCAKRLEGKVFTITVKTDPEGRMYGSVTAVDVVKILKEEGLDVDRRQVVLPQPHLKTIALHKVRLKLKEDVLAYFDLKVLGEGMDDLPRLQEMLPQELRAADIFAAEEAPVMQEEAAPKAKKRKREAQIASEDQL